MRRLHVTAFPLLTLLLPMLLLLLLAASGAAEVFHNNQQHGRVLLRDVTALTLRRGAVTAGRRGSGVAQLACVAGPACGSRHEPDVVQCTQAGFDGVDVQWKCDAELPAGVKFGRLSVSCEGYEYPDDPYITAGSCGLEYELLGDVSQADYRRDGHSSYQQSQGRHHADTSGYVRCLLCLGCLFVLRICPYIFLPVFWLCSFWVLTPPAPIRPRPVEQQIQQRHWVWDAHHAGHRGVCVLQSVFAAWRRAGSRRGRQQQHTATAACGPPR